MDKAEPAPLLLTGEGLSVEGLAAVARGGHPVAIAPDGEARLKAARQVVERALAAGEPVYGLNTGLGARAGERLTDEALRAFSYQTIRGRAQALGAPLPTEVVRAAMLARLNGFLKGASGVSPSIAHGLRDCLNARVTPLVGETASIGAGDLCWMASLARALIGEGEMQDAAGRCAPAGEVLRTAGLSPLVLGPKDGLALANNSGMTAGLAGLAVAEATRLIGALQAATALSLEAFRANLSPLDPAILAARPQAGQAEAAVQLHQLLAGSTLLQPGVSRRLQDPLSLRNVAQIHGAALTALAWAKEAAEQEINGSSDNPVVLLEEGQMISGGGYHTPLLTLALESLSRALLQVAVAQAARLSKLLSQRFSDLPLFLATPGSHSNGFAPLMKVAEALVAEIAHLAQPVAIWPSLNADGVEDSLTNAPLAAKNLWKLLAAARRLVAIELIVACQAAELRDLAALPPALEALHGQVRALVPPLEADRPLGSEIERLAEAVLTDEGFAFFPHRSARSAV